MAITTTKVGFRVEDVTFKNPRKQSEVDSEINSSEVNQTCDTPVSLTPESVSKFLNTKAEQTMNMQEKNLYTTIASWVTDYFELKKKVVQLEMKLEVKDKDNTIKEDI